jgi:protein-S-isoprenylcysteine O-methyltransferase Ste14
MHLFDERILGILILALLGAVVAVKQIATGSILDQPKGSFLVQLVNVFNLFFLLVVNPLAAVLAILRRLEWLDPSRVTIAIPWFLTALEMAGLVVYTAGFLLMVWALASLGRSYQLGGSDPRTGDRMVMAGPYRVIRHPMYAAALAISLGLACLTQALAFLAVFCIYLVLMLFLIPMEEAGLQTAYGDQYRAYQRRTKAVVPFLF